MAAAWGLSASGTPVRATLDYQADPTLEGCPSADAVRHALAAELGYDPCVAHADSELVLRVRNSGEGIEGSLELRGARKGRRVITSPGLDCREVVDSLVVAAAIALDPTALVQPAPSATASSSSPTMPSSPAPAAAPLASREIQSAPTSPPASGAAPVFSVLAGPTLLVGELPRSAPAIEAGASLRVGRLSLGLTGLASVEVETPSSVEGHASSSLIAANLAPCVHTAGWAGCLLASAGVVRAEGVDIDVSRRATRATAAGGVMVGHDWYLGGIFSAGLYGAGAVSLVRTRLVMDGQQVWSTPRFVGRLGCRMMFSF